MLKTVTTCYNGNLTNCTSLSTVPALPITETDVYTSLGSSGSNRVQTEYDSYGNVTNVYNYDFKASTATLQTGISYGTWNGSSCVAIGSYIYDRPCSVWKGTLRGAGYSSVLIVLAGDFNGDGKLDIAVGMFGSVQTGPVAVLPGDGQGHLGAALYTPASLYSTGSWLASADLNGDGKPDLVVVDPDDLGPHGGAQVCLNNGTERLPPVSSSFE